MTPEEVPAYLKSIQARVSSAAPSAAMAMARAHQRYLQNVTLVGQSPSMPGHPPGLLTGLLRDTVTAYFSEVGVATATASVRPNTIYACIQEYGGHIRPTRKHFLRWVEDGVEHFSKHVYLEPRPYMEPSRNAVIANGSAQTAGNAAFNAIVWGR